MLKKCEVLVDRVSLVVAKGSVVFVDDRQFETAKQFLKPLNEAKTNTITEPTEIKETTDNNLTFEKEVRVKKRKK